MFLRCKIRKFQPRGIFFWRHSLFFRVLTIEKFFQRNVKSWNGFKLQGMMKTIKKWVLHKQVSFWNICLQFINIRMRRRDLPREHMLHFEPLTIKCNQIIKEFASISYNAFNIDTNRQAKTFSWKAVCQERKDSSSYASNHSQDLFSCTATFDFSSSLLLFTARRATLHSMQFEPSQKFSS